MSLILFSVVIAISLSVLLSGVLAVISNPHSVRNRWFLQFSSFVSIWLIINYLGSNVVSSKFTDYLIKLDFAIALFIGWTLIQFASRVNSIKKDPSKKIQDKSIFYTMLILNLLFVAGIFAGLVVESSTDGGDLVVTELAFFPGYIALAMAQYLTAIGTLFYHYRKSSSHERHSLRLIIMGLVIAVITNLFSNLLVPLLTDDRGLIQQLNTIGYLGFFSLTLFTYVAIVKARLFNVKFIIARTITYSLLLGSLLTIYVLFGFGLSRKLADFTDSKQVGDITIFTTSLLIAGSFSTLKDYFNRFTNRFFYQDAYDAQSFIDEINETLVKNIEIDTLIENTIVVIKGNIKTSSCIFHVNETPFHSGRVTGDNINNLTNTDVKDLENMLTVTKKRLFYTLQDPVDDHEVSLARKLDKIDVDIIFSLEDNTADSRILGSIMLGAKKSGNAYTNKDLSILETIAKELSIAIQNSLRFEEIAVFSATLQDRVDKATDDLKKSNEKLVKLDEAKDEFISMASHQLRTPLTSVKGYISMVLEGDMGRINPEQAKMLDQAFISSQRMVYLIADLLNVSRLRTGKFVIEPKPTNLADLIEGEISQLHQTATARGIKIIYKKPKDFPVLNLDETKIRQVVMNFADNAIFYTRPKGTITIDLKATDKTITCEIIDTGIGVPKKEVPNLFSKFYRAENAKKARPDGTGLGLYMAKKVIIAQGGSLIFKTKEGKGSTFGFSFNRKELEAKPDNKS